MNIVGKRRNHEGVEMPASSTTGFRRLSLLVFVLLLPLYTCSVENPEAAANDVVDQAVNEETNPLIGEMVFVRGGTFTMGCTPEQGNDCSNIEKPAHQVTLNDFYIGKYEVTQAEWQAVMGNNPSDYNGNNLPNEPVDSVSWDDAQEFIKRLNVITGDNYRLPTEAEWEYAARGGNQSKGYKYSGSNDIGEVAWYGENSGKKVHPVGTKGANELGIHDMTGNVMEWVLDWIGDYSSTAQTNPQGPSSNIDKVMRGGHWNGDARFSRISSRSSYYPSVPRHSLLGFRLARGILPVTSQPEQDNTEAKISGTYSILKEDLIIMGVGDPFCKEFLNNLKEFENENFMACGIKFSSKYPEYSNLEWVKVDVKENMNRLEKIILDANSMMPGESARRSAVNRIIGSLLNGTNVAMEASIEGLFPEEKNKILIISRSECSGGNADYASFLNADGQVIDEFDEFKTQYFRGRNFFYYKNRLMNVRVEILPSGNRFKADGHIVVGDILANKRFDAKGNVSMKFTDMRQCEYIWNQIKE